TLLTLSRGAWVGMGAGILTAGILAWRAGGAAAIPRRTRWIVGAVLLVVMAAFLLDTPWRVLAARRLTDALGAGVGAGRMEIWRSAAAAWRERPIFGHGPDTFALVFPRFQTPAYWRHEWSGLPVHAHSIYLHTLATRGILGAAAVGIGFPALLVSARTAWRAGGASRLLVAAATAGLSALAVSGLSGSLGIGGTLLGFSLAAGLATLSGKAHVAHQRAASSDKVAIAAGIVAGAVMLGFATADLVASAQDREGMTLLEVSTRVKEDRVGELRRAAVKAYERATSLMPFEDGIVRRHADALRFLSAAEPDPRPWLREAEGRARRAVALAPLRALDHRFLGLVLLSQVRPSDDSRLAEGEACYERALELGPNDALTLLELVRAEVELGHPEKALRPALRVAALYPEQGETLAALANVHLALGEIDAAKVALRRSLAAEWRGDAAARQRAERTLVDLDARAK
ncbi:MAG TPA: O-antigen ligase family protein, partial [Candidatus Polarisedimenticolaceae bacterium]|nr:O-antigen ligase family protein [Candidatus Polarisedimenticolaceae bacterium]